MTEEVTGIDLVREMFRIAAGEELGYDDPEPRGHSIEFRVNAEDAGRNFLPAPGTITAMRLPAGPGVRIDAGYEQGMTVPQEFDSLVAKLIVTGATREQALQRARRALAEFEIEGMPTVLPFHRAVVDDPAFAGPSFTVHTRWIETEFDTAIPPFEGPAGDGEAEERRRITVEVGGKRLEVVLPPIWAPTRRGPGRGARAARPSGAADRRGSPRRAATRWSVRCRARSSRSSPRTATRSRPGTPSSSWRR